MDRTTRRLVGILLLILCIIIALIIEYFRLRKRRRLRAKAKDLDPEENLKYLKNEYNELKFHYDTARSEAEQYKWLREMKDVERKIILHEKEMNLRN